MRRHVVRAGESPGAIARAYTGDPSRWPELIAANPRKPRHGETFRALAEGESLRIPWSMGVGLSGAEANGIPSSSDIIARSVEAGENWLLEQLHLSGASSVVDAISTVAVDAWAGYLAGEVAEGGAVAGLAVASSLGLDSSSLLAGVIAASVLPVIGEVVGVIAAIVEVFSAFTGTHIDGVPGAGGPSVDPPTYAHYVAVAVEWVKDNPAAALAMTPEQLSNQQSIFVFDFPPAPDYPIQPFQDASGSNVSMPGAQSILRAAQLAAASNVATALPQLLPLYRVTLVNSFPLLSQSDVDEIVANVAPLHDALVMAAENWANAQTQCPTDNDVNLKFGLMPEDRAAVLTECSRYKLVHGKHQVPIFIPPFGAAPQQTSTAAKIAGTTVAAGAIAAGVAWGVAAYKGVALATVVHDWYARVRKVF